MASTSAVESGVKNDKDKELLKILNYEEVARNACLRSVVLLLNTVFPVPQH